MTVYRTQLHLLALVLAALIWTTAALAQQEAVPLSLEEAIHLAEEHNRELLMADQSVVQARGTVTEYRAAAYPQLDFVFDWKHNLLIPTEEFDMMGGLSELLESMGMPPVDLGGPEEFDLVPPDEFTFNVSLTQSIYTFGRLYHAIKLARTYVQLARTGRELTRQDVRLEVTRAYYQVLYLQELVEVARAALDQAVQTRDNLRARYEQGTISEFDYLRSQVEAANRRPPLLNARTAVILAQKGLKRLLGMDLDTPVRLTSEFRESPVDVTLEEARDEALTGRQELVALSIQADAAHREYAIYRADMLPSLSAYSNWTYTGSEQSGYGGGGDLEWYQFWDVGVQFYVPLFDGLRNWGRMRQARARQFSIELQQDDLQDLIRLEVESHVTTLQTIQVEFVAHREAVAFARRTVELANLRFENGLGTQLDVIDAETALTLARHNLADARYRYNVHFSQLERALGRY